MASFAMVTWNPVTPTPALRRLTPTDTRSIIHIPPAPDVGTTTTSRTRKPGRTGRILGPIPTASKVPTVRSGRSFLAPKLFQVCLEAVVTMEAVEARVRIEVLDETHGRLLANQVQAFECVIRAI